MRANQFTQKIINEALPEHIGLIDFLEERDKEDPTDIYYHIKLSYKSTIIYTQISKCNEEESPTAQEIIRKIEEVISEFNKTLYPDKKQDCVAFLLYSIRLRYYEAEFMKNDNDKRIYFRSWEKILQSYVEEQFDKMEDQRHTMLQVYDNCIRGFKKEVMERMNAKTKNN